MTEVRYESLLAQRLQEVSLHLSRGVARVIRDMTDVFLEVNKARVLCKNTPRILFVSLVFGI